MPVLNLTLEQWRQYHERMPRATADAARLGARSAALRVVALMVKRSREARPASPNGQVGAENTGDFVRGWRSIPLPDGARVVNDRPHAPIVEYGRRPGSRPPPIEPIVRWLQRRAGMSEPDARAAAPAVARAIGARGLEGRQILTGQDARAQIEAILDEEVRHELDRALARTP